MGFGAIILPSFWGGLGRGLGLKTVAGLRYRILIPGLQPLLDATVDDINPALPIPKGFRI